MPKLYVIEPNDPRLADSPNETIQQLIREEWRYTPPTTSALQSDTDRGLTVNGQQAQEKEHVDAFLARALREVSHRTLLKRYYHQSMISQFHAILFDALDKRQAIVSGLDYQMNIVEQADCLLLTTQLNTITLQDSTPEHEERFALAGSASIHVKFTSDGAFLERLELSNPTLLNSLFKQDELYFDAFERRLAESEHALSEVATQYDETIREDIRDFFQHLYQCDDDSLTGDKLIALIDEVTRYLSAPTASQEDAMDFLKRIREVITNDPIDVSSYIVPGLELLAGGLLIGYGATNRSGFFGKAANFAGAGLLGDGIRRYSETLFDKEHFFEEHPKLKALIDNITHLSQTKATMQQAGQQRAPRAVSIQT